MNLRYLILMAGLMLNTASADFVDSSVQLHPFYPFDGPYVIELSGEWPNDCHPGEQKPVIRDYTGDSVLIDFEIVVEHITCNQTPTPYRVLVDMVKLVGTVAGNFQDLEVTFRFGGVEVVETLLLDCGDGVPCNAPAFTYVNPENGFFHNPGLQTQGMLLSRQNLSMAAYPLTYDAAGKPRWLFAGGIITGDVYFGDLYEISNGGCLGCPLPAQPPLAKPIGNLTLLMDSPGRIQASYNGGVFTEYQALVFGYETFAVGETGDQTLVDLQGRWGISENYGTTPPLGNLTDFFPGAFDLVRQDIVNVDGDVLPDGEESYMVFNPQGEILGQLRCSGDTTSDGITNVCEFFDPSDASEAEFLFIQSGPSSLVIEYARAVIAIGTPPRGKAVRLD